MKAKKNCHAVIAGIMLILFILPVCPFDFFTFLGQTSFIVWMRPAFSLCVLLAGVFLIVGQPKRAAVSMTLACLFLLLSSLFANAASSSLVDEHDTVPKGIALATTILLLAPYPLFAAALWLRGRTACTLSLLSALAQAAGLVMTFISMGYVTGHPSPVNLLPIFWVIGAIAAGRYLSSLQNPESSAQ